MPKAPPTTTAAVATAAAKPAPKYEDAGAIEPGLLYADLIRRFGPPAMSMTYDGETALSYSGKGGPYQVKVVAGIVNAVEQPHP